MKHHIDSPILKELKNYLWNMRSQFVTLEFYINNEQEFKKENIRLLNYGIIQTDRDCNVISSNDSSYNYHFRRKAKSDPIQYYILTLDAKQEAQTKVAIISTDLNLEVNKDNKTLTLTWTSLDKESKKLIIISSVDLSTEMVNSRDFSLTRNKRSLKDIKREAAKTGKTIEEVAKKYVRDENMQKGGSWKVKNVKLRTEEFHSKRKPGLKVKSNEWVAKKVNDDNSVTEEDCK